MNKLISFFTLLLLPSGPSIVFASPIGTSVTNTLTTEYHGDNKDGENNDSYGIIINRLNLNSNTPGMSSHLRLDSVAFHNSPTDEYKNDLQLKRIHVQTQLKQLTITAGDYYRQLGRGIVLCLRKEDEIGIDIAIRGGELQYKTNSHTLRLFGGLTNTANLDSITQTYLKNQDDALGGLSYEFNGFESATWGLFGAYLHPRERIFENLDYTSSGGVFVEVPYLFETFAIYLEIDAQYKSLAGIKMHGFAGYSTVDAQLDDLSILFEGIYLVGFDENAEHSLSGFDMRGSYNNVLDTRYTYNRPPTLQRIQEEVLSNHDVLGGRLKLQYYFSPQDLSMFINGLLRLENYHQTDPILQLHSWGGVELNYGPSRLSLSGGYRKETQAKQTRKTMVHGEMDFLLPLGPFAVHLAANIENYKKYYRGSSYLGIQASGLGTITFEYGYDTKDKNIKNYFYAAILSIDVINELKINTTFGTQRGGLKCVGGACRFMPSFAGGRIEVVAMF